MKIKHLVFAGLALLATGCAALFFMFFERYAEEEDRGWSDQARRNPYLAAEQFLAASGIKTRSADNISVLATLSEDDTLYLANSSQIYNQQRVDELLHWIEAGGHAIVVANTSTDPENERDWLLQHLEIELVQGSESLYFNTPLQELFGEDAEDLEGKSASELLREYNQRQKQKQEQDQQKEQQNPEAEREIAASRNPDIDPAQLVTLSTDSDISYSLYFNPERLLWHPHFAQDAEAEASVAGGQLRWASQESEDAGVPLMQLDLGEGMVTVFTDDSLWQSKRIGQFDHAFFLAHLVGDGNLVLLTRPRFDSLASLAGRYGPEFFAAGFIALLAWLLYRSRRFGPMLAPAATGRRSLLEHISACGHYYWRTDRAASIYCDHRAQLLQRLTPGSNPDQLQPEQKQALCERIGQRSQLKQSEIVTTLWGDPPRSEEEFIACTRNIQLIEAAL